MAHRHARSCTCPARARGAEPARRPTRARRHRRRRPDDCRPRRCRSSSARRCCGWSARARAGRQSGSRSASVPRARPLRRAAHRHRAWVQVQVQVRGPARAWARGAEPVQGLAWVPVSARAQARVPGPAGRARRPNTARATRRTSPEVMLACRQEKRRRRRGASLPLTSLRTRHRARAYAVHRACRRRRDRRDSGDRTGSRRRGSR